MTRKDIRGGFWSPANIFLVWVVYMVIFTFVFLSVIDTHSYEGFA